MFFRIFIIFFLLFGFSAQATYKIKEITIGFIPGTKPAELKKNSKKLAEILEKKTGLKINVYVSSDYAGLVFAMKEKKIDFAFFSALTFVFAEKQAGAKVLLKKVWTHPYYYSALVALKKSGLKTLSQLKGHRIAFVDKNSASGNLLPQVMFKDKKIDVKDFFSTIEYSGNHFESIKRLFAGKVDVAAVYSNDKKGQSGAWNKYFSKSESKKVNIIWMSDPIPNDPFCVREDFYQSNPKLTHDLMFSLIELDDNTKAESSIQKLLGVSRLALATSRQYQPVRELVEKLGLKLDP